MASKRIDELTARTVVNTDLLPPTPSGGPSGSATVAAVVKAGLSQPNSASAGAGADITIKAADGVTSGAGGDIILQPGKQATTGGNGSINFVDSSNNLVATIKLDSKYLTLAPESGYGLKFTSSYGYENISVTGSFFSCVGDFSLSGGTLRECGVLQHAGNNSTITFSGSFSYTAQSQTLTTSQNNYVIGRSAFQRLNCTSASDITGIAPPSNGAHVDGRMIRVFNVGTANLTLKHNSSSSTAANRMYASSGSDIVLAPNDYAECVYDSTDNGSGAAGWRIA